MRVLLIGPETRQEIARLRMRLEERSEEALVIDPTAEVDIEITPDGEWINGIDLKSVTGAYVGDLGLPSSIVEGASGEIDIRGSDRARIHSQRQLLVWNLLLDRLGSRGRVVNPPSTHELHALKPWEVATYKHEGWPCPLTLATSDPDRVCHLPSELGGEWIRKGMVGGYGFAEAFTVPAHREGAAEQLSSGPVMIQERIDGDSIRAYVLGKRVIGAALIVSREEGEVDSRRGESRVRPIDLGPSTTELVVEAASHWGLAFSAVDLVGLKTLEQFSLLECNSSPFFVTFERKTGIDIGSRLANYLLGRD